MKIRPFETRDAEAVSLIYRVAAKEALEREPNYYRLPGEETAVEHFRRFQPSEKEAILVSEADGEIIGFVQVLITSPGDTVPMIKPRTAGFVKELAVAEAHRRKGLGKDLLSASEYWCREQGAEIMLLDTDWKNVEAIDFYEARAGYRKLGVILIKEFGT